MASNSLLGSELFFGFAWGGGGGRGGGGGKRGAFGLVGLLGPPFGAICWPGSNGGGGCASFGRAKGAVFECVQFSVLMAKAKGAVSESI